MPRDLSDRTGTMPNDINPGPSSEDRPPDAEFRDLGFGTVVASQSRARLLNRDGSFNVERAGLGYFASSSAYQSMLTMPWWAFFAAIAVGYLTMNSAFAAAYMLCGPQSLVDTVRAGWVHPFWRAFFFSVETSATIGYGNIVPVGLAANALVTFESMIGLLGLALATSLLFARFSRPNVRILFSRNAVIAPYRGITAFEFRIVNQRKNQIIELEAEVLFSRMETFDGRRVRRFHELPLERQKVVFFPLSWTIVHPIDHSSPLAGLTPEDLRSTDAEFLILLTGIDETFSTIVHTRSSYKPEEIIWNRRFANAFREAGRNGSISIDVSRFHDLEVLH
jgi:inward rectifier potassium channel